MNIWGSGYLTRALPAVVGHLFEDRDVLEIRATTHPDNLASVLALRRAGFGLETRIRQHDGWYEDLVGDDALRYGVDTYAERADRLLLLVKQHLADEEEIVIPSILEYGELALR